MFRLSIFPKAVRRAAKLMRRFGGDRRGNFAVIFVIALVPIGIGMAAAVELTQVMRIKQNVMSALDAATIAAGRDFLAGATTAELDDYASKFFYSNLTATEAQNVTFSLDFPEDSVAGGQLAGNATLTYHPTFAGFVNALSAGKADWSTFTFDFTATVRLKNTEEVALVLDNSGSMSDIGPSGITRLQLLKNNTKQLVQTLFAQGNQIKQLVDPVKFSVVPFSSAVNVAYTDAGGNPMVDRNTPWIDGTGISPIHNAELDWSKYTGAHKVGYQWLDANNTPLTRFTLFDAMKVQTGTTTTKVCTKTKSNGSCSQWSNVTTPVYGAYASWKGCVEARPYPYNLDDTAPSTSNPSTLFVPMFAPDEYDGASTYNNYWADLSTDTTIKTKQTDVNKYLQPRTGTYRGAGPNMSCETAPLIPLTTDQTEIDNAIDAMQANGATNVTEGMAWGMRTLSSTAPFTEGRSETEKGNDKIIVLVTDGSNTYYTPQSLGAADSANNKSIYAALGYTADVDPGATKSRIFTGTTDSSTYTNSNYTDAMEQQTQTVCSYARRINAATERETIEILVIALDLDQTADAPMIQALSNCASPTPAGIKLSNGSPKLFWNINSSGAQQVFQEIAELLSNLRITS
jgi:Flp pilus assembly protein TadG